MLMRIRALLRSLQLNYPSSHGSPPRIDPIVRAGASLGGMRVAGLQRMGLHETLANSMIERMEV